MELVRNDRDKGGCELLPPELSGLEEPSGPGTLRQKSVRLLGHALRDAGLTLIRRRLTLSIMACPLGREPAPAGAGTGGARAGGSGR